MLFARIADLFGRRSMFISSLFLFSVVALGAGFSKTPLTLDVLGGIMGLMSAAAVPPAQGMLGVNLRQTKQEKECCFRVLQCWKPPWVRFWHDL